jgi:NitT/TauT family transport system permease protein
LTLLVAEMLGVKAGLGWYMTWAQGWAQFGKVYASLIIIALLFSGIIAGLFLAKDRLLEWQKGLVRW